MHAIDLNADLGETVRGEPTADDAAMFAVVSSASIACGGHAGDDASMRVAVAAAAAGSVAVGAHPSFRDTANFGRVRITVGAAQLRADVTAQLDALAAAGADIRYVKPHGALYHAVSAERGAAEAVAASVAELSARLGRAVPVLGLDGEIAAAAAAAGLSFVREAFLDRGYRADGTLVPRGEPGALLQGAAEVAERAVRLAIQGEVVAVDGTVLVTDAASLCVHGDSPGAVAMALAARRALTAEGVAVRAPW
ncbi:LamB/YcsF family protein [Microbacterium sp. zg.Y625]|uniref:LamB/YcsF family protein n=1 Tax=Microbacterium jiangjiandongii TaxID=3049071 RepID=UPI00214BF8A7|nr:MULTISPECIES: LamB/YcsF family protein [unclassified Microbacterium]MCR2793986.1 LamB/YcsF family protein [Microbacterium sp. zg.Y625]WIM25803.1 LamB/YcsF family protein [Microbacterium sp. zg-Y625]